jgi:hypothetical protein
VAAATAKYVVKAFLLRTTGRRTSAVSVAKVAALAVLAVQRQAEIERAGHPAQPTEVP